MGTTMIQHRSPEAKPITTTIPNYIRTQAKKEGITITSLIIRGWKSIHQDTKINERLNQAEKAIISITAKLNERNMEIWKLQDAIENHPKRHER